MSKLSKLFKYLTDKKYRFFCNVSLGVYNKMDDIAYLKKLFFFNTNTKWDFKNPKTLDQKMQWLKIYDRDPKYVDLVDKYESKRIVGKKIGEKYIIPSLGCWDSFNDIDFSKLPEKFILKTTHDSGTHVICHNKNLFDYRNAKKILDKSLKRNYFYLWREWPYKNVKPRIIAEPLLENIDGGPLVDYKFYCYGRKPQYFMYSIGEAEHNVKNHKFDMSGKSIDYLFKETPAIELSNIKLPSNLEEMIMIVNKLCDISEHVRIDLFNVDGKIYMGEVTFCTNAGFISIKDEGFKQSLADMIDISKVYGSENKG